MPDATDDTPGRIFREAWITGVKSHYPGEPKPSYIAPWSDTPDWERASAAAVYGQVRAFVEATGGATAKLSREQRGRFVALCWIGQIYRHFPDPKPAYVSDWDAMPEWQRETDSDIFDVIERRTVRSTDNESPVMREARLTSEFAPPKKWGIEDDREDIKIDPQAYLDAADRDDEHPDR